MATTPLGNLFGHSPFTALQKHMRAAVACAEVTPDLFKALCEGNEEGIHQAKERIFELENQADELKNELRQHLPKSLFMPVDRRDLLEVLDMQDSIADTAQDIAGMLVERDMSLPEPMHTDLMEFVNRCVETCQYAGKIIEELDELLELGFGGKERDRVTEMVDHLGKLEDVTDQLGMDFTRLLFRHEGEMNPVSVMFWYMTIQWIGDLADYAEKVGNRLRLLVAR